MPSQSQRTQLKAPGFAIGTGFTTDPVDCSDATQIVVECYPGGLTANLQVVLEFSNAGDGGFAPEAVDDISGGSVVGNDYFIPVRRAVRTWTANTPLFIASPCGYAQVRVNVSASDNVGTCGVTLSKVANRG